MAELVTDYLEHTLPLRARLSARLHLLRCAACTRYFDQMRRTIALLRRGGTRPPDAAVEEAVLWRLNAGPEGGGEGLADRGV